MDLKISQWKRFYDVLEREAQMDGNLMIVPKLILKLLNAANYNQNVPLALDIFVETTSAAIQSDVAILISYLRSFHFEMD